MTTRDFTSLAVKGAPATGDQVIVQPTGDNEPERMLLAILNSANAAVVFVDDVPASDDALFATFYVRNSDKSIWVLERATVAAVPPGLGLITKTEYTVSPNGAWRGVYATDPTAVMGAQYIYNTTSNKFRFHAGSEVVGAVWSDTSLLSVTGSSQAEFLGPDGVTGTGNVDTEAEAIAYLDSIDGIPANTLYFYVDSVDTVLYQIDTWVDGAIGIPTVPAVPAVPAGLQKSRWVSSNWLGVLAADPPGDASLQRIFNTTSRTFRLSVAGASFWVDSDIIATTGFVDSLFIGPGLNGLAGTEDVDTEAEALAYINSIGGIGTVSRYYYVDLDDNELYHITGLTAAVAEIPAVPGIPGVPGTPEVPGLVTQIGQGDVNIPVSRLQGAYVQDVIRTGNLLEIHYQYVDDDGNDQEDAIVIEFSRFGGTHVVGTEATYRTNDLVLEGTDLFFRIGVEVTTSATLEGAAGWIKLTGGEAGHTTFTAHTDTPAAIDAHKYPRGNRAGDALIFVDLPSTPDAITQVTRIPTAFSEPIIHLTHDVVAGIRSDISIEAGFYAAERVAGYNRGNGIYTAFGTSTPDPGALEALFGDGIAGAYQIANLLSFNSAFVDEANIVLINNITYTLGNRYNFNGVQAKDLDTPVSFISSTFTFNIRRLDDTYYYTDGTEVTHRRGYYVWNGNNYVHLGDLTSDAEIINVTGTGPPNPTIDSIGNIYIDFSIPRIWVPHDDPKAQTPAAASSNPYMHSGYRGVSSYEPGNPVVAEFYYSLTFHRWETAGTDSFLGGIEWFHTTFNSIGAFGDDDIWVGDRDAEEQFAAAVAARGYDASKRYYAYLRSTGKVELMDNSTYVAPVNARIDYAYETLALTPRIGAYTVPDRYSINQSETNRSVTTFIILGNIVQVTGEKSILIKTIDVAVHPTAAATYRPIVGHVTVAGAISTIDYRGPEHNVAAALVEVEETLATPIRVKNGSYIFYGIERTNAGATEAQAVGSGSTPPVFTDDQFFDVLDHISLGAYSSLASGTPNAGGTDASIRASLGFDIINQATEIESDGEINTRRLLSHQTGIGGDTGRFGQRIVGGTQTQFKANTVDRSLLEVPLSIDIEEYNGSALLEILYHKVGTIDAMGVSDPDTMEWTENEINLADFLIPSRILQTQDNTTNMFSFKVGRLDSDNSFDEFGHASVYVGRKDGNTILIQCSHSIADEIFVYLSPTNINEGGAALAAGKADTNLQNIDDNISDPHRLIVRDRVFALARDLSDLVDLTPTQLTAAQLALGISSQQVDNTVQIGNATTAVWFQKAATIPAAPSPGWVTDAGITDPNPWSYGRFSAIALADSNPNIPDTAPVWIAYGFAFRNPTTGNYTYRPWNIVAEYDVQYTRDGGTTVYPDPPAGDGALQIRSRLPDGNLTEWWYQETPRNNWVPLFGPEGVYGTGTGGRVWPFAHDLSLYGELRYRTHPFGQFAGTPSVPDNLGSPLDYVLYRVHDFWPTTINNNDNDSPGQYSFVSNELNGLHVAHEDDGNADRVTLPADILRGGGFPAIQISARFKIISATANGQVSTHIRVWDWHTQYERFLLQIWGRE